MERFSNIAQTREDSASKVILCPSVIEVALLSDRCELMGAPPLETLPSEHSAVAAGRPSQALAGGPGLRSASGHRPSVGPAGTPASGRRDGQSSWFPRGSKGGPARFTYEGAETVSSGMQRSSPQHKPVKEAQPLHRKLFRHTAPTLL